MGQRKTDRWQVFLLRQSRVHRQLKAKGKEAYQWVLAATPFYAESGGQVGDKGSFIFEDGTVLAVTDTKKENNLILLIINNIKVFETQFNYDFVKKDIYYLETIISELVQDYYKFDLSKVDIVVYE